VTRTKFKVSVKSTHWGISVPEGCQATLYFSTSSVVILPGDYDEAKLKRLCHWKHIFKIAVEDQYWNPPLFSRPRSRRRRPRRLGEDAIFLKKGLKWVKKKASSGIGFLKKKIKAVKRRVWRKAKGWAKKLAKKLALKLLPRIVNKIPDKFLNKNDKKNLKPILKKLVKAGFKGKRALRKALNEKDVTTLARIIIPKALKKVSKKILSERDKCVIVDWVAKVAAHFLMRGKKGLADYFSGRHARKTLLYVIGRVLRITVLGTPPVAIPFITSGIEKVAHMPGELTWRQKITRFIKIAASDKDLQNAYRETAIVVLARIVNMFRKRFKEKYYQVSVAYQRVCALTQEVSSYGSWTAILQPYSETSGSVARSFRKQDPERKTQNPFPSYASPTYTLLPVRVKTNFLSHLALGKATKPTKGKATKPTWNKWWRKLQRRGIRGDPNYDMSYRLLHVWSECIHPACSGWVRHFDPRCRAFDRSKVPQSMVAEANNTEVWVQLYLNNTQVIEKLLSSLGIRTPHQASSVSSRVQECEDAFRQPNSASGGGFIPECTSKMQIAMGQCTTCCCKDGLTSLKISHSLIDGRLIDCGVWFGVVDSLLRSLLGLYRSVQVIDLYAGRCFQSCALRSEKECLDPGPTRMRGEAYTCMWKNGRCRNKDWKAMEHPKCS